MCLESKSDVKQTRKYLKNKIINSTDGFCNHETEEEELINLLKRSVENGESNSALIIGPRGSGKTTLVKEVLKTVQMSTKFELNAILIRLNGLIHTDDKLALKSCALQMNLENAVDGKVFGTFAENLAFLLECLCSGQRNTSKSLIFILEELDLFCAHHNQTLLYNLFDMTHSSQTPMCVIGVTCRLDAVELFEKRVKSRFSHRQIYLFPGCDDEEVSKEMFFNRVQSLLSITNEKENLFMSKSSKNKWNKHIESLIKDPRFKSAMSRLHSLSVDERVLKNILIIIISKLNENKNFLTLKDFLDEVKNFERDDKVLLVGSLSVQEICLLIAMKHHVEIYDNEPFNFEMILTRYSRFASANSLSQTVQPAVLLKSFEHLKGLELIQPIGSSDRAYKEFQLYKLLADPQQIVDGIKQYTGLPTAIVHWANNNFI